MSEDAAAAQSAIDSAIANANAAEAAGNHAGRIEAARAALALKAAQFRPEPQANPSDAKGASARLAYLEKDAEFRQAFFAGHPAAREEFDRLNQLLANADPIERALTGAGRSSSEAESGSGTQSMLKDEISFVADGRAAEIPDEQLALILKHRVGTEADMKWAQQQLSAIYAQFLRVPLAQWPPAARRAVTELAAIASPTETE